MKPILLRSTVRGIGCQWQIVPVDDETAHWLMTDGKGHDGADPSIRLRFGELIRKRAEYDARVLSRS